MLVLTSVGACHGPQLSTVKWCLIKMLRLTVHPLFLTLKLRENSKSVCFCRWIPLFSQPQDINSHRRWVAHRQPHLPTGRSYSMPMPAAGRGWPAFSRCGRSGCTPPPVDDNVYAMMDIGVIASMIGFQKFMSRDE